MIAGAQRRLIGLAKRRLGPFVARRQPARVDLSASLWDLTVGPNGRLWSGPVDLEQLAQRFGTPLHVARGDLLERNTAFIDRSGDRGPRCEIFASYKTNPVPTLLSRLHARGVGAEVISSFELWLALQLSVPPSRIIYNGPAKSADSIRLAIDRGIYLINANSASELNVIARLAADAGTRANVGIRVALPGMWGGQFGIASTSPQVMRSIEQARDDPFVELRGLHFHRGLTMREHPSLTSYVTDVLAFCDEVRRHTGWQPDVLDLGGSLACPTVGAIPLVRYRLNRALGSDLLPPDPATAVRLDDAASIVATMVVEHYSAIGLTQPTVVLEPGRALTANTQFLLTTVVDVKTDGPLAHAVLDAGINVAEPVPNEYHQLLSVSAPSDPPAVPYRLVGPICTPMDVLYPNWRLPRLEPGHVLAIMDSGAYFIPQSTAFSFPRAAVVLQDGADVVVCRERESFTDMVRNDSGVDAVS